MRSHTAVVFARVFPANGEGPYAQRYLLGLMEYLDDPWNCNDALSLLFVTVAVVRVLAGADSGITALVSTFGTLLLWVRMHYGPPLTLAAHLEANT